MINEWINLCLAVLTAGSFYGQQAAQGTLISADDVSGADALSGSYVMVTEGYDWGPGVSEVILELDEKVAKLKDDQFVVIEEKQAKGENGTPAISRTQRMVKDAFLSNAQGDEVTEPSEYVTIQMHVAPQVGNPFFFSEQENHYVWAEPYRLAIDLKPGTSLKAGGESYSRLAIARTPTQSIMPQADLFEISSQTAGNHRYDYAHYTPQTDGGKHPLIVWLHGLGEGGRDPRVALLGGRATAWAGEKVQSAMNGAYVLIPQCPTMWVDAGGGMTSRDGKSQYTDSLLQLIHWYVREHPEIDPNRVYVGGCSNGGYMTLALLLAEPDFFAAGFPVCEAYLDSWLDEQEIRTLSRIPMWFVHSELDKICPPERSTFPTVERIKAAGGNNIHLSRLGSIIDHTGLIPNGGVPYLYNAHYAWVPVLNGECTDSITGQPMFQWLAAQKR